MEPVIDVSELARAGGPARADAPVVVVGVDGSVGSRSALVHALATARRRGADLDVVSTYTIAIFLPGYGPPVVPVSETIRLATLDAARAMIEEERQVATSAAGSREPRIRLIVTEQPAAQALVERAVGADLLVVGSRGRGVVRSLALGSVALHCVAHAPCPVLVVPTPTGEAGAERAADRSETGSGRVVVGADSSYESHGAVAVAIEEAARIGARLEVVVALQLLADTWEELSDTGVPATVEGAAAELRTRTGQQVAALLAARDPAAAPEPSVEIAVVEGAAAEVLMLRSQGADLLVVGSRGLGTFRGMLLGSVAL